MISVMSLQDTADRQLRLERELAEERAAALRRISETLQSLIDQLTVLRGQIGAVHWSDPSPELARYRALRRQALKYRWYLEVQRESMGLRGDYRLDEFYPIPAPL